MGSDGREFTPVLCRSASFGVVSDLRLSDENKMVVVKLSMTRAATRLLVDDSRFGWSARYSSSGLSGLNTLVSGNYIQVQPGISKKGRNDFTGLENPPVTPPGVPGLHFKLVADEAGGLGPGAAIVYKGIRIGKLETRTFHTDPAAVEFDAFLDQKIPRRRGRHAGASEAISDAGSLAKPTRKETMEPTLPKTASAISGRSWLENWWDRTSERPYFRASDRMVAKLSVWKF